MDCNVYKTCPKEEKTNMIKLNKPDTNVIAAGCWGVYCQDGETIHKKLKVKKGISIELEKVVYGGKRVADCMSILSNLIDIDAVILAGDNVYGKSVDDSDINRPDINSFIDTLHDVDMQLDIGFRKCMRNVKTDTFMIGVGNHDVKTCDVINKQLSHNGIDRWKMPGLSYNQVYELNDGTRINYIFMDTNLYDIDENTGIAMLCPSVEYPIDAREKQVEWMAEVIIKNNCKWNIVIGHIPVVKIPHKKGHPIEIESFSDDLHRVSELILPHGNKLDLYLCADEHNQQYISCYKTDLNLPPIAVIGSGGNHLDKLKGIEEFKKLYGDCIKYTNDEDHGFVQLNITNDRILLIYYSTILDNSSNEFIPSQSAVFEIVS